MDKRIKRRAFVGICALLLAVSLSFSAAAAIGQTDYVVDDRGKVPLPKCYVPEKRIERVYEGSYLNAPQNLYVDAADRLYVADAGNNRIVVFDPEMQFLREYTAGNTLKNPSGVFCDTETGEIYIADTDNERIVVVDSDDRILREYRRPESELLDENMTFTPTNVSLGVQGYLYVLKGQSFMQLDQEGEFKGFVGSTKVPASILKAIIRRFASEKQKKLLVTEQPNPYVNFTMDRSGVIYAVVGSETSQIRKVNMAGDNLFPEKFYGEMVYQGGWKLTTPGFRSIAVSDDGIISVLEEKCKRIYQLSQDGTLLNVFGGEGEVAGFFQGPVALACDSKGSIYVSDTVTNTVQRFKRTAFVSAVYAAQAAYDQGDYEEAYELYARAKLTDPNYSVLNNGMADCLYKLGRMDEAAEAYRFADNRESFGRVQKLRQKQFVKQHFGWIVLAVAFVVTAAVVIVYRVRKYADALVRRFYHLND